MFNYAEKFKISELNRILPMVRETIRKKATFDKKKYELTRIEERVRKKKNVQEDEEDKIKFDKLKEQVQNLYNSIKAENSLYTAIIKYGLDSSYYPLIDVKREYVNEYIYIIELTGKIDFFTEDAKEYFIKILLHTKGEAYVAKFKKIYL